MRRKIAIARTLILHSVRQFLSPSEKRARLARELKKLDIAEERRFAEEGLWGRILAQLRNLKQPPRPPQLKPWLWPLNCSVQ
jgi:hypothetical protein